jgi:vitamin B12 transporter
MIGPAVLLLSLLSLLATGPAGASPRARIGSPAVVDATFLAVAHALPDTVVVLPEVRVDRERRRSEPERRVPTAFVSDLPARSPGRAVSSLAEVMRAAAGVNVVQYGGLGAFSTVSLRGAPAGQVAVFLDGAPITSAAHGVVNLSDLPVTAVERVEVYRGGAPLGFGAATPGGAINLVTAVATDLLEARVSRGSFDTWEGRASAGARRGALSALVHAGYQGSAGDFRYHDDNGTPFNPADDSLSTRVNDRFDAATVLADLTWRPARGTRVTLRQDVFHKAQGLPGLGVVPARNARLGFARALTQLEAEREARGWMPALRARAGLQRERSRLRDLARNGELGLGRHDTDDHVASDDASVALQWPGLPGGFALEGAGSLRAERATLADAADPYVDPPPSARHGAGAMAGVQWRAPGERLLLRAARRWDRLHDQRRTSGVGNRVTTLDVRRTLDSPQLGARLVVGRGLELRANWSEAQRAPDFLELFGNQGFLVGNAALQPERGSSWDAGGSWSGGGRAARLAVEWAHYESRPRDLIQYVRLSQSHARAVNVSAARIRGEELTLSLALPRGCALRANSTWQSAIDDGDVAYLRGRRLPQRPERQGDLRLDAPAGPLRVGAEVQYMGDDLLDPYNRYRVPSRTLVGASLSWALRGERLRLTLEGKNLTDRRVSDVAGYPLPGRSVFLACESRLGPAGPIHR